MSRLHNREAFLYRQWLMVDGERKVNTRSLLAAIRKIYREAREDTLARLARELDSNAVLGYSVTPAGLLVPRVKQGEEAFALNVAALLDVDKLNRAFDGLGPRIIAVIKAGFEMGLIRAGVTGIDFTSRDPGVLAILDEVLNKTKGANATLARRLAERLQLAISGGATADQLAPIVKTVFDFQLRSQARTIAQTAATPAFEFGQVEAFQDAGITHYRWLSQRDDKVRPTHRAAEKDNGDVAIGMGFQVGETVLRFPGDPNSGDLKEIINCRCTLLPILKKKSLRAPRRLIKRAPLGAFDADPVLSRWQREEYKRLQIAIFTGAEYL